MKRLLLIAPLAAVALTDASAQPYVYEYCSANTLEAAVADATAMMIPKAYVHLNPDNVTYTVDSTAFTEVPDSADPVCSDEPFYLQQHPIRGRTAFFVGGDLMVTAPHLSSPYFDPKDFAMVFGLRASLSGGSCQQPDFAHVPASKVFYTAPSPGHYVYYNPGDGSDLYHGYSTLRDQLLFKLDRPVTGITPLPLRRSGQPDNGDPLFATGHGNWLPLKIARDVSVGNVDPLGLELNGMPRYTGFSGSPVFGSKTELVETLISGGTTHGPALGFNVTDGCSRTTFPGGPGALNNGDIKDLAAHVPIPPTELQLSPTETTVHYAPVGGTLTNQVSTFTIAPPPTATSTLTFRVGLPALFPPAPSLTISPPPGDYSLSPGSSPLQFTVTAGMGSIASCRALDTAVGVLPLNHAGFAKRVRHRFEVGMSAFTVAPTQIDAIEALGAPYPTRTVEISNPYGHPSSVAVTPQAAWIRVNGAASTMVNLTAKGSPGDHATVTLSFDETAAGFPAVFETKTSGVVIAASPTPQCGLNPPVTIPLTLTRGTETFSGIDPAGPYLPLPGNGQTFGAVTEYAINVAENAFTVDDVNVSVRFYEDGTSLPPATADSFVKIELVAPDGTSAVLWDRNNAPSNYFASEKFDLPALSGLMASALKLDQSTTPPLGSGSLATFNGHSGVGLWKARLWTSGPMAAINVPEVALHITKKRQASFYTFNTVYDYLPGPAAGQTFGPAADFLVDLSAEAPFRVDDVDLKLGFYTDPGGTYRAASDADTQIRIELTSPAGTTSMAWDRNNASSAYLGNEIVNWLGAPTAVTTLGLDTTTTPPLGGGTLTAFNSQLGNGVWRVRMYTTDTTHTLLPSHVNLLIGR